MALILNRDVSGKRCWACGREIGSDEVTIVSTGARDIMYMHSNCAQSVSRQLLRDLAELVDLGYELEDEQKLN